MKRLELESREEFEIRKKERLDILRINTAVIVACQVHLEKAAKALEDNYPQIEIADDFVEVFTNLNLIGDKLTKYAEEVMES